MTRTPIPLRWSETAEADRICNMAMLEYEPQSAAQRFASSVAQWGRSMPGLLLRWIWALRRVSPQIRRDSTHRVRLW